MIDIPTEVLIYLKMVHLKSYSYPSIVLSDILMGRLALFPKRLVSVISLLATACCSIERTVSIYVGITDNAKSGRIFSKFS